MNNGRGAVGLEEGNRGWEQLEPSDCGLSNGVAVLDMVSWPGLRSKRNLAATLRIEVTLPSWILLWKGQDAELWRI